MPVTITEALAEIKLIEGKIKKKQQFVLQHLGRQEGIKDPFEKDGGTAKLLKAECQAIGDLTERWVKVRAAIRAGNTATLEVNGLTRTVSDWLVWRREVAPIVRDFYDRLTRGIAQVRNDARSKGLQVVQAGTQPKDSADVLIEIDELDLAKSVEEIQEIIDRLDGKLSLHNATVTVDV